MAKEIYRYTIDIYYLDGTVETRNVKCSQPLTLPQLKASVMRKFTPSRLNNIKEIKGYERIQA